MRTSSYRETLPTSADQAHTLFGQTMGYVAATAGFFALGAIFLDALNVFTFFLRIFSRNDR